MGLKIIAVDGKAIIVDGMALNAGNLNDTTDATAAASDILESKTAYSGGTKITGSIPTKTSDDVTSVNGTVTIPAGYYATEVQKQGDPSGDATMTSGDQMLKDVTAYSKGTKYTGTIEKKKCERFVC